MRGHGTRIAWRLWWLLLVAPALQAAPPAPPSPGETAMVRLRIETDDDNGAYLAIADNTLAGPVEVLLRANAGAGLVGEPALPARAIVPARASVVVARVRSVDAARGGDFDLRLQAVPGTPNAKPQDFEYTYPLPAQEPRVEQGWGGRYSHGDDENRYAIDFAAGIGTTVVAARDGVVMQVASDFSQASLDAETYGGRANFIRILHDDGSMAVYAHLEPEGVLVRIGQRVRRGQAIGLSGNTGFSSGPHLHFVVQANRGLHLVAIPFRMFSPRGILRFADSHSGGDAPASPR